MCIIVLGVQGQHGLEVFIAISFCLVAKLFMSNSFVTLWTTEIFQKGSLNCARLSCLYLHHIRWCFTDDSKTYGPDRSPWGRRRHKGLGLWGCNSFGTVTISITTPKLQPQGSFFFNTMSSSSIGRNHFQSSLQSGSCSFWYTEFLPKQAR